MRIFKLLTKNLFRNPLRTLLTLSSIAVSLFLVATLISILDQLTNPPETPDSGLRLITRHKISLFNVLPYAYRARIDSVEGVDAVVGSMWFGGLYDHSGSDQMLAQFAVDTDHFFDVNPDMELPQTQKEAFLKDRAGAIVGDSVADQFGWSVGDTIHTKSNLFPVEAIELKIHGIYRGGGDQGGGLYFHWEYFNEAMNKTDFTGTFSIRVNSPKWIPVVAEKIDEMFKNTSTPTKTETEKAFILGFVSMLGNVQLLISGICSAVLFAVLLVAANTMAMSIRERVREIGILKAIGFRKAQVLGLLMGESLLLSAGGAFLGSLAARLLLSGLNMTALSGGYLRSIDVSPSILGFCTLLGLVVGLLSAGVPAWRAAQRPVVQALRNVV